MEASLTAHPDPRGRTHVPWGMLAAIDLHGCERSRLEDPDTLRRFVPSLIDAIGMRAHGPLALDRFGDGELEGWSAMQLSRPVPSQSTPTRSPADASSMSSPVGYSTRRSRPRSPSLISAARSR
jgi:hypothetical protein